MVIKQAMLRCADTAKQKIMGCGSYFTKLTNLFNIQVIGSMPLFNVLIWELLE